MDTNITEYSNLVLNIASESAYKHVQLHLFIWLT